LLLPFVIADIAPLLRLLLLLLLLQLLLPCCCSCCCWKGERERVLWRWREFCEEGESF